MRKIIAAAEMREIDAQTSSRYLLPSLLLMESAAQSSLRAILNLFPEGLRRRRALVLCGRGNNGGDGAALARLLWLAGVQANVILFGRVEDAKGDARTNFEIARSLSRFDAGTHTLPPPLSFNECQSDSDWEELSAGHHSYDIIVDALFGTGLARPLEGVYLKVVEHLDLMRRARERAHSVAPLIVSLDIPSGLDADSSELIGEAVRADLTVTFTAPKRANVLPPAADHNGQLEIADIGSPPSLLEASASGLFLTEDVDAREWLVKTRYLPGSYKNTHGHAFVFAGSRGLTGAAALTANASLRAGAGLVTLAIPLSAQQVVAARTMPEVMTEGLAETEGGAISSEAIERAKELMKRADVVSLGPGLTREDEGTRRFVREVVEERTTPVVIDADGLNALAPWPIDLRGSSERPIILTPHPGEMLRLLGTTDKDALKDKVAVTSEFAARHNLILVLKGARTMIAAPDGRVFVNPTGNAGLGTAGAGDTLTGIITGFLAQAYATLKEEADALAAVIAAVYVGGLAGDLCAKEKGMRAMTASDIREHLGAAILSLDAEGELP
ncbi:MAG: NAD(P)H-hydrate dehydratase [Pyrinomonadaceae bacterium]|nr:NAD(P)H-hydrate dehydratase [Pyrinomonadaceae bacterium]